MSPIMKAVRSCLLNIIDGPNREDMVNKFEHCHDKNYKIDIDLTAVLGTTQVKFEIEKIFEIKHIKDTGHDFEVVGQCATNNFHGRHFRAKYSTALRKGEIFIDLLEESTKEAQLSLSSLMG